MGDVLMRPLFALFVGLGVALTIGALAMARRPPTTRRPTAWVRDRKFMQRLVLALAAGIVVVGLTRWVLAGVAAAGIVFFHGRVFGSKIADQERARLEGIAEWLEALRDALTADASLPTVLAKVNERPPLIIADEIDDFDRRWRHGLPLRDALVRLAESLSHPTADVAVAAMVFSMETSGPKLYAVLDELAITARAELGMRERVDRVRAQFEVSAKAMFAIGVFIVIFLLTVGKGTLDPYRSALGQIVLAVPLLMWAATFWWLKRLSRYEMPQRFIVAAEAR
jgi:Flp pilus assembly protein TadB